MEKSDTTAYLNMVLFESAKILVRLPFFFPRGDAGGLSREYVICIPSVSPACRKRRLNGAPLYSLSR